MSPARPPRCPLRPRARGAALVTAMIFSVVIGISLVSYLRLSSSAMQLASRSFLNASAVNIAELGLEHALFALNQNQANGVALATAWADWTTDTTNHTARRTLPASGTYTVAPGATAIVKVFVQNYDLAGAPVIVAKATLTPGDGTAAIEKFVEVKRELGL